MNNWMIILIIASVVLAVTPGIIMLFEWIVGKCYKYNWKRVLLNPMMLWTIFLLLSIWVLRLATGLYIITVCPENSLYGWEEIINSLIHALQTFSMDEDYTEYLKYSKGMMDTLTGGNEVWRIAMGAYSSLLNAIAPVVGGALILEIIANIFPRIRLYISALLGWKQKYYFSELNEGALAFVQSIREEESKKSFYHLRRPIIIFTDVYVARHEEKDSEMLKTAKSLGAICVRDDLAHVPKRGFGKRLFFLIEINEAANLQALVDLSDEYNYRFLKNSTVCLLAESDSYSVVEAQVRNKLIKKEIKRGIKKKIQKEFKVDELPRIIPVQYYRNLISNLLVEVPLYEPLVAMKQRCNAAEKEPITDGSGERDYRIAEDNLDVTIFGNGIIGTEAVLSSYWFGQMLGVKLNISVVSKDPKKEFYSKLNYINPEIRQSTDEKDPILIYKYPEKNPPYASIKYCEFDVKSGGFWGNDDFLEYVDSKPFDATFSMSVSHDVTDTANDRCGVDEAERTCERADDEKNAVEEKKNEKFSFEQLLDTDYFIIALGSDKENLDVANKLYRRLGEEYLEQNHPKCCVIAYVIYDSDLCEALNINSLHTLDNDGKIKIYMKAFGSLKEVYSYSNIFMTKNRVDAEETGAAYNSVLNLKDVERDFLGGYGFAGDYKVWANLSRAMHLKYKVFSMGWIKSSVFDEKSDDGKTHEQKVREACNRYKRIQIGLAIKGEDDEAVKELNERICAIAWLEHRRWNAFTRVKGFRSTKQYARYYDISPDKYKEMSLKLHPCLVESDIGRPEGIKANLINNGDELDLFSCMLFRLSLEGWLKKREDDRNNVEEPHKEKNIFEKLIQGLKGLVKKLKRVKVKEKNEDPDEECRNRAEKIIRELLDSGGYVYYDEFVRIRDELYDVAEKAYNELMTFVRSKQLSGETEHGTIERLTKSGKNNYADILKAFDSIMKNKDSLAKQTECNDYFKSLAVNRNNRTALAEGIVALYNNANQVIPKSGDSDIIKLVEFLQDHDKMVLLGVMEKNWSYFKEYDYPQFEFDKHYDLKTVASKTRLDVEHLKKLCKKRKIDYFELKNKYYIPNYQVEKLIRKYNPRNDA